ncbi:MAG: hypothetical protein KAT83_02870 [Candidatus Aenigmarchaeota archaeon]|nr:hypothetical protein [Candidatus Aenigmarchaeota archaeon]
MVGVAENRGEQKYVLDPTKVFTKVGRSLTSQVPPEDAAKFYKNLFDMMGVQEDGGKIVDGNIGCYTPSTPTKKEVVVSDEPSTESWEAVVFEDGYKGKDLDGNRFDEDDFTVF